LASLRIKLKNMSVLDVGAGIGDHSHFYIDRGCSVTVTDARIENLTYLRRNYLDCNVQYLNMESPSCVENSPFDIVHCYGLLYHLSNPKQAIEFLSQNTRKFLFLETCVSFGDSEGINLIGELQTNPTQAYSGIGCRPTRIWIFKELQKLFKYVYLPTTQPWHDEFPLDWSSPGTHKASLARAIFVGSRELLENENLTTTLLSQQSRHE
jgi:hypothetical protein